MNKTIQREAIMKVLKEMNEHPTADEVYAVLRHKIPQLSLATVYRNLKLLAEDGQISKIETSRAKHYDAETTEHFHIFCPHCEKITNLYHEELYRLNSFFTEKIHELGINSCKFILYKCCDKCSKDIEEQKSKKKPQKIYTLFDD